MKTSSLLLAFRIGSVLYPHLYLNGRLLVSSNNQDNPKSEQMLMCMQVLLVTISNISRMLIDMNFFVGSRMVLPFYTVRLLKSWLIQCANDIVLHEEHEPLIVHGDMKPVGPIPRSNVYTSQSFFRKTF
jgi:hypothetical protein